jgi:hypothetical protein
VQLDRTVVSAFAPTGSQLTDAARESAGIGPLGEGFRIVIGMGAAIAVGDHGAAPRMIAAAASVAVKALAGLTPTHLSGCMNR